MFAVRYLKNLISMELCRLGPGPIMQASDGNPCTDVGIDHTRHHGEYSVRSYAETLKVRYITKLHLQPIQVKVN